MLRLLAGDRPGLAYGMGRSYGDVCLNPGNILWKTRGLDRFIAFDQVSGRLSCEAGILLRDIQQLAVPRGWILPVTPGTLWVTVGGAIANDVHGKNHHVAGCFGDHVRSLRLVRTDGEIIDCGPDQRPDWFAATVGGLGLTGVIVSAEVQLRRVDGPWLDTEVVPYRSLDEFFALADESEMHWEHTVSWIDCTAGMGGRGIFLRARPGGGPAGPVPPESSRTIAFVPPVPLVNRLSARALSTAYFRMWQRRAGPGREHYKRFLYPLDHLLEWNRLYGPAGFFQYQCVVPRQHGDDAVRAMLQQIAQSGQGSLLTVLKTFGRRQAVGMLSFAQPGVTLALDFPNRGQRTLDLFDRLDAIVRQARGRIYPAKDARMPPDLFESGYPHLAQFLKHRDARISSALSRRLIGS